MLLSLNHCGRCNQKIIRGNLAYFRLNERTDRFDLECEHCYMLEEYGLLDAA